MALTEVARFQDLVEGDLALAFLRAHGIEAELAGRGHASIDPVMQRALGVRIMAPEAQREEALALLARARAGEFATDEGDDLASRDAPAHAAGGLIALATAATGSFSGTSLPRRLKPVHWIGFVMVAALALTWLLPYLPWS
ncbi:MAG: DUF2007 domain-containing protein [Alphaproteobacteria bacterium]|nr:DUF2007 domain-containing protein [Alphaproteobacteria bacterium]MBU1527047.1 DUF2007 domain-containing protein [Alphaproteobacteria bacterium]MBU2118109.1 DUF2007 domain-containing protein [Alphaproteobacteria bacterium]MBU2352386.1 DUF2007 domain-containing protein [Alphaproteobacteria bacterium]MBU2382146.1 DUF2007 domain-containing protein [Alphaproteobacteria bacterium]